MSVKGGKNQRKDTQTRERERETRRALQRGHARIKRKTGRRQERIQGHSLIKDPFIAPLVC